MWETGWDWLKEYESKTLSFSWWKAEAGLDRSRHGSLSYFLEAREGEGSGVDRETIGGVDGAWRGTAGAPSVIEIRPRMLEQGGKIPFGALPIVPKLTL